MSGFASGVAVFSDGATIDAVSPAVSVEKKGSGALVALVVEEKDPPRRKSGIQDLASECVVNILEFLRAVDLCSVSEVDRTVFSAGRLRLGISFQLNHLYPLAEKSGGAQQQQHTPTKGGPPLSSPTTYGSYLHAYYLEHDQAGQDRSGSAGSGGLATPDLSSSSSLSMPVPIRSNSLPGFSSPAGTPLSGTPPPCGSSPLAGHKGLRSPSPTQLFESSSGRPLSLGLGIDLLYTREIKSIIAALSSPQPLTGRCFWVSAGWVANAKKYYEALSLPDLTASSAVGHAGGGHRNKSGHKKSTKIRLRRGSDALPPWPQMNADLTCVHGRLSLAKCPKGKRRLMSASAWHLLRKFYPQGPVYPAGGSKGAVECHLCSKETDEAKLSASQEREREITRRAEMIPERLLSLHSRKSGVPTELLAHRRPISTDWEDARGERELGAARATTHVAVKGGEGGPVASGLTLAMRQASIGTQGSVSVGIGEIAGKEGGLKEAPTPNAGGRPPLPRTPSFTVSNSPFDERRRHNSLTSCSTNSLDGYSSGSDCEDHDKFLEMYGKCQPTSPHDAGSEASPSFSPPSQPCLSQYHHPLLPGIYHLLPRDWLKRWRHYTKDPVSTIPLLDCTSLLCHSHGLFVIPPHLEEYLLGLKRSLLGGLGQYPGVVVEIISLEEWEALHHQLRAEPDFCVRFCLSAEGDMAWNVGVCGACDPFTFSVNASSPKRRTGESPRGGNGTHRGK